MKAIADHLRGDGRSLDLPIDVAATAFQWKVWRALQQIPAGETRAYAEVARSIGKPRAVRAVASACATNPVCPRRPVPSRGAVGGRRRRISVGRGARKRLCVEALQNRWPLPRICAVGTLVFSVPSIRYGISPWLDAVPVKKRPEFPAFRGVITHPVVVVGGGMSGAMTAYACAAAGPESHPARADRVGHGGTGRRHRLDVGRIIRVVSRRRSAGRDARRGRCSARDAVGAARSGGHRQAARHQGAVSTWRQPIRLVRRARSDKALRKEIAACPRRISSRVVAAAWRRGAAGRHRSAGGMRTARGGFADPFKLTLGFLTAAIKRGAKVYERSRVKKITFTRKTATAFLDSGSITTTNLA